MSEKEKDKVIADLNNLEVTELDDRALEEASGGGDTPIEDAGDNNYNCGCNGKSGTPGSGNTNCGC
jgi:hypothetical protein